MRIPSAEEIAEIQTFGRQVEWTARRLHGVVDLSPSRAFARRITAAGKTICANALAGLAEAGVDVRNPVQLLYVLKGLGPVEFEREFGAGELVEATGRRKPLVPTDMGARSLALIDEHAALFGGEDMRALLGRRKLLLASTDVHSHAIFMLEALLHQSGADVINAGPEQSPAALAAAAAAAAAEAGEHGVEAILLSTHNGMALEYAQRLQAELARRGIDIPVLMGGVLNQAVPDLPLPVDVTAELRQIGIHTATLADSGGWQFLLPAPAVGKGDT